MTPTLVRATGLVVEILESQTTCRKLRTFEDWHEHDGYNKDGIESRWAELRETVDDERMFRAMSPEDDYVRRSWLPDDASFYLRWLFYREEPGPGWSQAATDPVEGGDLDLSASAHLIAEAGRALAEEGIDSHVVDAVEFFNSR